MTTTQQFDSAYRKPRYSKEEFARRGEEIYQSQIRSQVEEGNLKRSRVEPLPLKLY